MSLELLKSKKFFVAVAAVALAFAGVANGYTPEQLAAVVGPLVAYILGQGIADYGKEAQKVANTRSRFSGAQDQEPRA